MDPAGGDVDQSLPYEVEDILDTEGKKVHSNDEIVGSEGIANIAVDRLT